MNLTTTELGAGQDSASRTMGARINSTGHVPWARSRFSDNFAGIFCDAFNLSRDALGTDPWIASTLAIGDGGHCL